MPERALGRPSDRDASLTWCDGAAHRICLEGFSPHVYIVMGTRWGKTGRRHAKRHQPGYVSRARQTGHKRA